MRSTEVFTYDVTAKAGFDYTDASRTLIFNEGQRTATFELFIHDLDTVPEGIETLRLEMRDLVGTLRGEIDVATVFIEDDDGN